MQQRVISRAQEQLPDPSHGLTLEQARRWFLAAREENLDQNNPLPSSTKGKAWVDDTLQTLFDMIAQKRGASGFISGHRILADAVKYHSPRRTAEVADEIYGYLKDGKIVILDLSVGDARIRDKVSTQIAAKIFQNSMNIFVEGKPRLISLFTSKRPIT